MWLPSALETKDWSGESEAPNKLALLTWPQHWLHLQAQNNWCGGAQVTLLPDKLKRDAEDSLVSGSAEGIGKKQLDLYPDETSLLPSFYRKKRFDFIVTLIYCGQRGAAVAFTASSLQGRWGFESGPWPFLFAVSVSAWVLSGLYSFLL